MNIEAFLAEQLARPMTHRVVTTYADGNTKSHDTFGAAQAENWAVGERRKIGRDLTDRTTGSTVRVVSVEVAALA
ncbi:hypothetical protein ACFFTN_01290 [Aminobacter aganoensis]|uniref:CO dehydrogenase nickel-insertion accessory protein CooC1 n=1 Tax=Aminobacter aganoensis TaxID=83264 RepID=A0A7X0F5K0_9HYPH|nr:hypothetical protein [Aminobacter aganoensis]MBB6353507.1 CO dehydrogenase nickel-insertion accessory protein CooC1 [Aminobacter aganoensis]